VLKYFKLSDKKLAERGQVFSSNKMNLFLPLVLVTLLLLLSSCSERSEYGKKSGYEKLGANTTETEGGTDTTAPTISSVSPTDNSTYKSPATTICGDI